MFTLIRINAFHFVLTTPWGKVTPSINKLVFLTINSIPSGQSEKLKVANAMHFFSSFLLQTSCGLVLLTLILRIPWLQTQMAVNLQPQLPTLNRQSYHHQNIQMKVLYMNQWQDLWTILLTCLLFFFFLSYLVSHYLMSMYILATLFINVAIRKMNNVKYFVLVFKIKYHLRGLISFVLYFIKIMQNVVHYVKDLL